MYPICETWGVSRRCTGPRDDAQFSTKKPRARRGGERGARGQSCRCPLAGADRVIITHLHWCSVFVLSHAMRIDRHHRLALRVLQDGVARAACGEVERTWGHRLALDLLVRSGIAEGWQARAFWDALAMQWERHEFDNNARYEQVTQLQACVTDWSHRLGIAPLDPVEMRRLERPYLPDLAIDAGTQQLPCMCNRLSDCGPGNKPYLSSLRGPAASYPPCFMSA